MGVAEGIGILVVSGFVLYASWKDRHYMEKFNQCSRKVDKIKCVHVSKAKKTK